MQIISRKSALLAMLFKQLDVNGLGRIDAVCAIFVEGSFEQFVDQIFVNFSYREEKKIHREELVYFIDALFRGLAKVYVKREEANSDVPGKSWRLMPREIDDFVIGLFIGKPTLSQEEFFINFTQMPHPMIEFLRVIRATVAEEF